MTSSETEHISFNKTFATAPLVFTQLTGSAYNRTENCVDNVTTTGFDFKCPISRCWIYWLAIARER